MSENEVQGKSENEVQEESEQEVQGQGRHDIFIRWCFSNKDVVIAFCRWFLPADVLALIDLSKNSGGKQLLHRQRAEGVVHRYSSGITPNTAY